MGVYPAMQASRADLVDGLKEGGRGTSGSIRQQRLRKILIGAQVALSVTLLAGAALLIEDLSSANGVFVDGERLDRGPIADGQWIAVGHSLARSHNRVHQSASPRQCRTRNRIEHLSVTRPPTPQPFVHRDSVVFVASC